MLITSHKLLVEKGNFKYQNFQISIFFCSIKSIVIFKKTGKTHRLKKKLFFVKM